MVSDGRTLSRRALAPGIHVWTERCAQPEADPRAERARLRLEALFAERGAIAPAALEELLRSHGAAVEEALCVHLPQIGYGTRCSTVIGYGGAAPPCWRETEGAPCRRPYRERSAAFAAVLAGEPN